jgi:hypothetical protein
MAKPARVTSNVAWASWKAAPPTDAGPEPEKPTEIEEPDDLEESDDL